MKKRFHKGLNKGLNKGLMSLIVFSLLGLLIVFSIPNSFIKLTGKAVYETNEIIEKYDSETILQNYNSSSADLSINEPKTTGLFGEPVTENKNKRMEFQLEDGNLRLYFDLLNYSEFIENIGEISSKGIVVNQINETENNSVINITEQINKTISNITTIDETEIINETNEINNTTETQINETENQINQEENINENQTSEENQGQTEQINETFGITGNIIKRFYGFYGLIGRVIGIDIENSSSIVNEINNSIDNNENIVNQTDNQLLNNSISNQSEQSSASSEVNIDLNEIKETVNNLSEEKIKEISDNSAVKADNFEIIVNDSKINQEKPEFKWGYKVKLNDLKFMAKIDVTSNQEISKYNDYSLKIGSRNLLSFEDLIKQGYKIRIETPVLEIPIENLTIKKKIIIINETEEKIIKNISEINITEVNITQINLTETNITEINITTNITEQINETISNVSIVNKTITNITITNETETPEQIANKTIIEEPIINESQEQEQPVQEIPAEPSKEEKKEEQKETKEEKKEEQKEEKSESKEEKQEKSENKQEKQEEIKEKEEEKEKEQEEKQTESEIPAETPIETQEPAGVTGNIIKNIKKITGSIVGVTGKIIFGIGNVLSITARAVLGETNITQIEDVKYENTISVYIERDFSDINNTNNVMQEGEEGAGSLDEVSYEDVNNDGVLSIGDIINLDPSLIIIPATDAEHLDSNRSFISNIYNEIKSFDNNWSEIIPINDFVRVVFKQALGKNNDITVFARKVSSYDNASENSSFAGNASYAYIKVYKKDGNETIAVIENITTSNYYKTYLDGSSGAGLNENETSDTFDLRILGGSIGIESNSFVIIDGKDVPYDIYQKKKRIDEIWRLLNQS